MVINSCLRRAVFGSRSSCKFVEELLDISNAARETLDLTAEIIEATFYRHEPLFRLRHSVVAIIRRQAANKMVLLAMLPGTAREFRNAV
jgi:hypothetical protein